MIELSFLYLRYISLPPPPMCSPVFFLDIFSRFSIPSLFFMSPDQGIEIAVIHTFLQEGPNTLHTYFLVSKTFHSLFHVTLSFDLSPGSLSPPLPLLLSSSIKKNDSTWMHTFFDCMRYFQSSLLILGKYIYYVYICIHVSRNSLH